MLLLSAVMSLAETWWKEHSEAKRGAMIRNSGKFRIEGVLAAEFYRLAFFLLAAVFALSILLLRGVEFIFATAGILALLLLVVVLYTRYGRPGVIRDDHHHRAS
jgi:hypothetical protein